MTPKVIIDTNVWISGIFWKGSNPYKITKRVVRMEILTFFSDETFREWDEKVRNIAISFGATDDYLFFRKNLLRLAKFVYPKEKIEICRDVKDNKFLDVALVSEAEFVISGDLDLVSLKKFRNITIITPSKFLKLF